jgi:hypothetical protein
LTERQREIFVDKLPDLANLAVAGLVFGQLLMEGFSVPIAVAGVCVCVTAMAFAVVIGGGVHARE